MKTLALFVLVAGMAIAACEAGPLQKARDTQVSFANAEGTHMCGGTAIGRRTVLTASHCLLPEVGLKSMDGKPVVITVVHEDGKDHALVYVDRDLPNVAKRGRPLAIGDDVYVWGRPHGLALLFRKGYYAGDVIHPNTLVKYYSYDIEGIFGDSGSGIFNSQGQLVGMVSQILSIDPRFRMVANAEFEFTPEQWKDVK